MLWQDGRIAEAESLNKGNVRERMVDIHTHIQIHLVRDVIFMRMI